MVKMTYREYLDYLVEPNSPCAAFVKNRKILKEKIEKDEIIEKTATLIKKHLDEALGII